VAAKRRQYVSTDKVEAHASKHATGGADPVSIGLLDAGVSLTGIVTPAAISASQDDYNPTGLSTANTLRLATNNTTQRNITGLTAMGTGRFLLVHNVGPGPIAFIDEGGTSAAANRFSMAGDMILLPDSSMILQYDGTSSRWRVFPRATASTSPAVTFGTANAGGTSPYFVRSDDQLALFDATVPTTQAFGDTAAAGSAGVAARRDHKHAMPVAPTTLAADPLADAKGDTFAATAADTIARVPVGANGQVYVADSSATAGVAWRDALVASLTAPTAAIANTETVIVAGSLAANSLKVGDTFLIKGMGVGTTSTSPGTGTWRLRCNPTTLTGSSVSFLGAGFTASRTAKGWSVEFLMHVYTLGGTGTVMGEGIATSAVASSSNDLFGTPTLSATTAALTVDTTVTNLIELTFISGAASANITAYTALIRRI
jgi:hypothetical protein